MSESMGGIIPECPGDFVGIRIDYRTMWEFVHAEKLSYKKRR
jgi:hypothetical protein